ncbi:DUF167 domain-containing protein [Candidatus Gottesmanbacteria bacterium]|nr:DUF167 domain-containing protein [Candidatus Gottesmanbacteria bacterium]
MKIFIRAKPKNKKAYVKKVNTTHFIVAVKEPPVSGKANNAIIQSLSKYFNKPQSQIFILSGETSKQKIIEVPVTIEEIEAKDAQKKLF